MTTLSMTESPAKVASSIWQESRNGSVTCLILVAIPRIGFSLRPTRSYGQLASAADVVFDDYDDDAADRMIDDVAAAVESETHAPPQVLKSSALVIADLDRDQIRRIAALPSVRKIGPNVGFTI